MMIKNITVLIILTIITLTSCNSVQSDEEQIENVYKKYYNAVLNKRTDVMVECVNTSTLSYYNEIVRMAQFSDSIELSLAPLIDKTLALFVRNTMNTENLKVYSGKELMFFTFSKGINTQSGIPKVELKKAIIKGDKAEAGFLLNGMNYGNLIYFIKENDKWKINLSLMYIDSANKQFKQQMLNSGLSESAFIQMMVTKLSGIKMKTTLWNKTIK